MSNSISFPRSSILAVTAFALVGLARAQTPGPLNLKHGVYVLKDVACHDAPNAAIVEWDGVGLSGAHASKCVTKVVDQHGSEFHISTSCAALGDGTPTTPDIWNEALFRKSDSEFVLRKPDFSKGTNDPKNTVDFNYRLCGPTISSLN